VHEGLGTRRFNRKVRKGRKVGDGRDRPLFRTLRVFVVNIYFVEIPLPAERIEQLADAFQVLI
jgi:hypothetical protein